MNRESLIIKLSFPNGIHLGKNKLWDREATFMADTLFSAMVNEAKKFSDEKMNTLINLVRGDKLLISDSFPFLKDNLFLPKPYMKITKDYLDPSLKKIYKKIEYVPHRIWNEFKEGDEDPEEIIELLRKINSSYNFTKIYHDTNGNHEIYEVGVNYFKEESGLYFIVLIDKEYTEFFKEILMSLSYTGIGGKRNIGFGKFNYIVEKLPFELENLINNESKLYMSLSISLPKEEELYVIDEAVGVSILRRGGFIYSENKGNTLNKTIRKKDIYMCKSGSVFTAKFKGDIYDLARGYIHPVYRYAKPMFIGV